MRTEFFILSCILASLRSAAADGSPPDVQFSTIANFTGDNGNSPPGLTLSHDGYLYGCAGEGPSPSNGGEIYRVNPATEKIEILYIFSPKSGYFPNGKLALKGDDVFGITAAGGARGAGTVYRYSRQSGVLKVLHNFGYKAGSPSGGVIFGQDGQLYGVTMTGGAYGYGTVFRLDPSTGYLVDLHDFSGPDGYQPSDGLLLAPDGTLYGSAAYTDTNSLGVIFSISPATGAFHVLYGFQPDEGAQSTKLAIDATGALYSGRMLTSTTGTILRYTPSTGNLTSVVSFGASNGPYPIGGLAIDQAGNLYGATASSQTSDGALFRISAGSHVVRTLYTFNTGLPAFDGYPVSDLITTRFGLFGSTLQGGNYDQGTIFQLMPGK